MGRADGGELFDAVARVVLAEPMDPGRRTRILTQLIGGLQDMDWDTEDEALARYTAYPEVVEAFHIQGISLEGEVDSCSPS